LDSALAKGGTYLSEFRIDRADRGERWLRVRGHAEPGPQSTSIRHRGVLVDITEPKQAALQREELAHLSRVALLAELSGSLAHELNQPLTSILSNAQAAQRFMAHQPPNLAEVSESLTNIVESDKRAGEVIRRLRAMLRKEPADFRPIELNEVVQDVLRIIRSDLLNKNVDVQLRLQPDLPRSEGDRVQLQQVLLNLIVNGSDAMRDTRDREMIIHTRSTAAGGVELTVSDRGHGIPADDLHRIFASFVTSKPEGMGLGLAVCKTIIESHGGRLWATNNNDVGASLHFSLPVFPAPENGGTH
jgi:C4-dicarboxylate-specific signal transduction histidine kinase